MCVCVIETRVCIRSFGVCRDIFGRIFEEAWLRFFWLACESGAVFIRFVFGI